MSIKTPDTALHIRTLLWDYRQRRVFRFFISLPNKLVRAFVLSEAYISSNSNAFARLPALNSQQGNCTVSDLRAQITPSQTPWGLPLCPLCAQSVLSSCRDGLCLTSRVPSFARPTSLKLPSSPKWSVLPFLILLSSLLSKSKTPLRSVLVFPDWPPPLHCDLPCCGSPFIDLTQQVYELLFRHL